MELNRTDLAIETRESFPEDNVEIEGVVLNDKLLQKGRIRVSTVNILNEKGAELMGKPAGNYVTIEFTDKSMYMDDKDTKGKQIQSQRLKIIKGKRKQKHIWL